MATKTAAAKKAKFEDRSLFFDEAIAAGIREAHARQSQQIVWPSTAYWDDPAKFFIEVMSFRPWAKQIEIAEAIRDNPKVAVSTCHKMGKSVLDTSLAAWFFSSLPDARVVMTSTTAYQVKMILWREMHIRMRWARLGICYHCRKLYEEGQRRNGGKPVEILCPHGSPIDYPVHDDPALGIIAPDMRQIVGFTGRDAEAVAGVSSPNLLYICDEASGIEDPIFAAIEGNRAGGARLLLTFNPTRNEGKAYDAINNESSGYVKFSLGYEDSPNVKAGWRAIPGMIDRPWVDEMRDEWGEDSPDFTIRVKGKHAIGESGKTVSLELTKQAEDNWYTNSGDGHLYIGLDPAGDGFQGDESVFAPRRGKKILELRVRRGLNEQAHLGELLLLIDEHHKPNEAPPIVVMDKGGDVGAKVYGILYGFLELNPNAFVLIGLDSSNQARKNPIVYDKMREDIWANFVKWIRDGGGIPTDTKLNREIRTPHWFQARYSSKMKLMDKVEIRKVLKRSPDRADACALSCYESESAEEQASESTVATPQKSAPRHDPHEENEHVVHDMNPYAWVDAGL